MKFSTLSLAVAAVASLASIGSAAPLTYSLYDTRTAGSATPVATPTNDGDGSLELKTFDGSSQGKVSVMFGNGGAALGTLGSLNQLMVDFYKSSTPATGAANQFAYRIHMDNNSDANISNSLVWENNYNGSATVPTDAWQNDFDLLGGNFWLHANLTNYNGGSDAHPLSYYIAGNSPAAGVSYDANSPVYGLEIAFGSGVSAFTGNVDDVKLAFANGTSYVGNVVAPEPASLAALAGAGLIGLRRRRRA